MPTSCRDTTKTMAVRQAALVGAVLACCLAACSARQDPAVVTFDAEEVVYDMGRQVAELHGNVRIYVCIGGEPQRRAVIHAQAAKVDLKENNIGASGGISVATEDGVLQGDSFQYNGHSGQYRLTGARGVVSLSRSPTSGKTAARGYLTGRQIGSEQDFVYLIRGRITTCDKAKPHYALLADKIRYRSRTGKLEVWNPRVRIYGVTIPGYPGRIAFKVGGPAAEQPHVLAIPRYSSLDKLYLPYDVRLAGDPDDEFRSVMKLRISQQLGIRGRWETTYEPAGDWQLSLLMSRLESAYDDFGDLVLLDRQPELRVVRDLLPGDDGERSLTATAALGRLTEDLREVKRFVPSPLRVSADRAMLQLRYQVHATQQELGAGHWYGICWQGVLYDGGRHYRDVCVWLGAGTRLAGSITGSLTAVHHFTGGDTPLLLDTVDIRSELQPRLDLQLSRNWSLAALARYDLDRGEARDYELTLSRRVHCLTWRLGYRKMGHGISLGVDINGLTGRTAAQRTASALDRLMETMQADLAAGPAAGTAKPAVDDEH